MNDRQTTRTPFFKLLALGLFVAAMLCAFAVVAWYEGRPRTSMLNRGEVFVDKFNTSSNSMHPNDTTRVDAEIGYNSEIVLDAERDPAQNGGDTPLLPPDRPDWVAAADDVKGEVHRISVGSELEDSIDACRKNFGRSLVQAVLLYIDRYLQHSPDDDASNLVHLNESWIREHLMAKAPEYEAVIERSSGKYHQLWTQLEIDPKDRATIKTWLDQLDIRRRAGNVGLGMVLLVAGMSLVHVVVKFVERPKPS